MSLVQFAAIASLFIANGAILTLAGATGGEMPTSGKWAIFAGFLSSIALAALIVLGSRP